MAAIDLTVLDSGKSFSIDESNVIRISDLIVDGVTQGLMEYVDQADGIKKSLIIDENVTNIVVGLLNTDLESVTLFANSEVVLLNPARFSVLEDVVSKVDGTTTVGLIKYDAAGSQAIEIETISLTAANKLLI